MLSNAEIMRRALKMGLVIPAFNVPYLPMVEPVIAALRAEDAFGFIATARLEWIKFHARGLAAVMSEFRAHADPMHAQIHLDHVPVIDEDDQVVDYVADIGDAIRAGYESVMVDGSRLSLEENIACTARIVTLAHATDIPVEAELGAAQGEDMAAIRAGLGAGIKAVEDCVAWIVATYAPDIKAVHAGSVPFLKLMGIVCGGWQMARAALVAQKRLDAKQGDTSFYQAKIATARFYADHILAQAPGLRNTVVRGAAGVMALTEEQF